MTPLNKSPFSRHFRILLLLGAWAYETQSPTKEILFIMYKLLMTLIALVGVYGLMADLYDVIGDMKKMAWNLCVSVLFIASLAKNFQLIHRNHMINKLRLKLHEDAESRSSPEHITINKQALKELKFLQVSFYGTAVVFIPIWLLTRYFGHRRELPVPLHVPEPIDLEDDLQFGIAYFLIGFGGVTGIVLVLESELAAFGLLIQVSREYRVFLKDILELNTFYENHTCKEKAEVNPGLKRLKTQMMIKKFSARQKELIEYTKTFEICYSQSFLQQIIGITILVVTIAIQCMMEKIDVFGNFLYQVGYLFIVVVDLFLLCWFSTRIKTMCFEVGDSIYSTLWYKMDPETQKDLVMMILRSQHPPKLTAGKLMELSLNAFIYRMTNIYSWLALFRQLEFKITPKDSFE